MLLNSKSSKGSKGSNTFAIKASVPMLLATASLFNAAGLLPGAKADPPAKSAPAAQNPLSKKGATLFTQNHCSTCHSTGASGGCLGPPLAGVGVRRSRDFIAARITADEKAIAKFHEWYPAEELMPHPRLPQAEASAVVAYLMTLPAPPLGFETRKHTTADRNKIAQSLAVKPGQEAVAQGRKAFYGHGCVSCHAVGGIGGQFAPDLAGVARRHTKEEIAEQISGAESLILGAGEEYQGKGATMPPSGLSPTDIRNIVEFLMTLKQEAPPKGDK